MVPKQQETSSDKEHQVICSVPQPHNNLGPKSLLHSNPVGHSSLPINQAELP